MTPSEVLEAGNVPDGAFGMLEMEDAARVFIRFCADSPMGWQTDLSMDEACFQCRDSRVGFLELLYGGWLDKSFASRTGRHAYNGQFGLSRDAVRRIVAAVRSLKRDGA